MAHAPMLFPELAEPSAAPAAPPRSQVIRFTPRPAGPRRRDSSRDVARLGGDGLAARLRRDVERQLAHRRRMLGHLEGQRNVNCKA